MKRKFLTVALTTAAAIFTFTACQSTKEEKLEDAQENIEEAREDLNEAAGAETTTTTSTTVTVEQWNTYRTDIDARIKANNERIAELRAKIKKPGVVLDERRQKRIDDLEARNARLKQQLADYKIENGGWDTFKSEIDKELDEMSRELDEMVNEAKK